MSDKTAAEDGRQVRVIAHGVAGVDRKPTPAALKVAPQCGALFVPHWHLRGVADQQVTGFDYCRIVVVREHVGADAAGSIKRVEQFPAREIEVVVTSGTAADQIGRERRGHVVLARSSVVGQGSIWLAM